MGFFICYNQNMFDLAKYANMKICVAVSGGRDSMALLHYFDAHKLGYGIPLSALNCDHKIRGEASARDSAFVREWCAERNIPLYFFEWNTDLPKTEANARFWRLKCYSNVQGVDAVATAHHMNDNAETVLFNLARGSALSGMEGITDGKLPSEGDKRLRIIHPLIACPREEIDNYIEENKIPFVDDATNFEDGYTRNKIRLNVLPELEKAVPGAVKAIYRFSRLAADDEEYFDNLIKERKLLKRNRHGLEISHCKEKVVFKRAVIKALAGTNIKDYTSEHAQRLYDLQFAEKGKKFEFLGFTAFKESGKIAICDTHILNTEKEGIPFKEHCGLELSFLNDSFVCVSDGEGLENRLLAFEAAAEDDNRLPEKFRVLKFDFFAVPETAVIRFMKEGDKFTKFGGGTKNLGDYFTDRKIPPRIRKRVPLVADGSEVLAVGGVEISDKIKITDNTEVISYLICEDYTV